MLPALVEFDPTLAHRIQCRKEDYLAIAIQIQIIFIGIL